MHEQDEFVIKNNVLLKEFGFVMKVQENSLK